MPISFTDVPSTARTPFVFVEFDPTKAQGNAGPQAYHALIVGQRLTGHTGTAELIPVELATEDAVAAAFGTGSMIHQMAVAFFAQGRATRATFIAVDDPSGGTAAQATITFTASSPKAGQVVVYVGGRRYSVPCTTTSTATTLAAALVSKINADPMRLAGAANTDGVVTLTARHAGAIAGVFDVRHSYYTGEALPVGVTAAIVNTSVAGAGDVDLAEVIAAIPDEQYHVIATPYTGAANLTLLEAELADRFGPERQLEGVAFSASSGNLAALQSINRNSPHVSILGAYGSPTPTWELAAAVTGQVAKSASIDPNRPFQTLELVGCLAPTVADSLTRAERDLLLHDGIATAVRNASGNYAIERLVTAYTTNNLGAADTAYLDVTTLTTLSYLRWSFRTTMQVKFPRYKLASDGTRVAPGQAIVTPKSLSAEVVALAGQWEERGLIENLDQFKADLLVERNSGDPTRVDFYLPPDLVNGLRVVAAAIGFRL